MNPKKEREKKHLHLFKSIYTNFPAGKIEPFEHPDFLLHTGTQTIGIEHTDYIKGHGEHGSDIRKKEVLHKQVAYQAKNVYETRNRITLQVTIHCWSVPINKKQLIPLANAIAEVVERNTPQKSWLVVDSQKLGNFLSQFLHSITIARIEDQSLWVCPEFGWIGVGEQELQKCILSKEPKVREYRNHCDLAWLLIVADGDFISSVVQLRPSVKQYLFKTDFDSVYFLDCSREGSITQLLKASDEN